MSATKFLRSEEVAQLWELKKIDRIFSMNVSFAEQPLWDWYHPIREEAFKNPKFIKVLGNMNMTRKFNHIVCRIGP